MTASQFASLLRARRIGRGKWQAKCPSHPDRKPSLSIAEGKRGVLIRCMSNGCDTADILDAMGLEWNDLFFDKITPQVRARTSLQDRRENLERRLGLVIWLGALDSEWAYVEKRIRGELQLLRCRIEPLKVIQEQRGGQWKSMTQGQRDKYLEGVWERLQS